MFFMVNCLEEEFLIVNLSIQIETFEYNILDMFNYFVRLF